MMIEELMERTAFLLLQRQIQERTERKRLEGNENHVESEYEAICDTLDALIREQRGPECKILLDLVRDKYPKHYGAFEIDYAFKL